MSFRLRHWRIRAIPVLLAASVLVNIILASKLYLTSAVEFVRLAMQSPPRALASDRVRGRPEGRVTVIAYMDYQCPYCARLDNSLRTLMQSVDAKLIYRHFPLDSHPQAAGAAEAAECAGAQGKYWDYSDRLFAAKGAIGGRDMLGRLASEIGLDGTAFGECLAVGKFKQRVAEQYAEGKVRRIRVTPTFFVDGKRYIGALPDETLRDLLRARGT